VRFRGRILFFIERDEDLKRNIEAVLINPLDNVAVAIAKITAGTTARIKGDNFEGTCVVLDDVPFCHKFALTDLARGDTVRKYGSSIGVTIRDIKTGERVDHNNIVGLRGKLAKEV
jgi:altronate dehydratase small subunit